MPAVDRLRLIVAWTVFVLWASSAVYDAASANWDAPSYIQNAFILVAGFLFTPSIIKAATKRED